MGANEKREECGSIGNVRARKRSSRAAQDRQRQEHGVSSQPCECLQTREEAAAVAKGKLRRLMMAACEEQQQESNGRGDMKA